jgi:peptide/nickel transport system ATP-binding protein
VSDRERAASRAWDASDVREGPPLLEVRNLVKHYPITQGVLRREVGRVHAVDGVSFTLKEGEALGIVGESGCGKSTTARVLLRLEEPTAGEVLFDGEDVTGYDGEELRRFHRRAQMIFQDPTASFDPRMSIGESVAEPLVIHGLADGALRRRVVGDLLGRVGLTPEDYDRYPHEFSGGQKQRVALARALVLNPDLIVADEPTSALDVSTQSEIIALLKRVQAAFGLSLLFISHDTSVIREVCDRVAVMYAGEIVELAPTEALFERPGHPYTRALLASIPEPDPHRRRRHPGLAGDVPDPTHPPSGCRFHTRCPEVIGPPGYAFEQAHWRAVLHLRTRLEQGRLDLDAIRAAHVHGVEADGDALAAAIRATFDLPERLSDPAAEAVLEAALGHLVAGDLEAARALLTAEFPTVCVNEHPELRAVGPERLAACHLHDQPRAEDE